MSLTNQESAALEWALQESGLTVRKAILGLLAAPSAAPEATPRPMPRPAPRRPRRRRYTRLHRVLEYADTQLHVRAADLVVMGLAPSLQSARAVLADAVAKGELVRIERGVYQHRSFLEPPDEDEE